MALALSLGDLTPLMDPRERRCLGGISISTSKTLWQVGSPGSPWHHSLKPCAPVCPPFFSMVLGHRREALDLFSLVKRKWCNWAGSLTCCPGGLAAWSFPWGLLCSQLCAYEQLTKFQECCVLDPLSRCTSPRNALCLWLSECFLCFLDSSGRGVQGGLEKREFP